MPPILKVHVGNFHFIVNSFLTWTKSYSEYTFSLMYHAGMKRGAQRGYRFHIYDYSSEKVLKCKGFW